MKIFSLDFILENTIKKQTNPESVDGKASKKWKINMEKSKKNETKKEDIEWNDVNYGI